MARWLLVAIGVACGPSSGHHISIDAPPTNDQFRAFYPCDTSWDGLVPAGATCQTPCIDMSNLGEATACTATSPLDGTAINCDPNLMTMWGGHHGCCFNDAVKDPMRVDFADCM